MRIPCPWCGARDHTEFTHGGDGAVERPVDPMATSDADWIDYVYIRDNPRGPYVEWWHHGAGCRRWFRVRRDTRTHAIIASAKPGDVLDGGGL